MRKHKKLFGLTFGLLALLLITTIVIGPSLGTLYCCQSMDPTIDGYLGPSEWKDGIPKDLKLHDLNDESETLDVEIQSIHGADLILYTGVTFLDSVITPLDLFFIVYKQVEGDPLVLPPYNENGSLGLEHDVKALNLYDNYSIDCFSLNTPGYDVQQDTDVGGVNNGDAKCYNNGTHTTIEMMAPFDSGDALGHDFKLAVGIRIDIMIWFYDGEKGIVYGQVLETTNDYEWLTLYIGCTATPTPLPIFYVILGLATSTISILIFKRRRK